MLKLVKIYNHIIKTTKQLTEESTNKLLLCKILERHY